MWSVLGLSDIIYPLQGKSARIDQAPVYVQTRYLRVSLVTEVRLKRSVIVITVWEVTATKVCIVSGRKDKEKRKKRMKGG